MSSEKELRQIVIVMEGGVIQTVMGRHRFKLADGTEADGPCDVEVYICDYDAEGSDGAVEIDQEDGRTEPAIISGWTPEFDCPSIEAITNALRCQEDSEADHNAARAAGWRIHADTWWVRERRDGEPSWNGRPDEDNARGFTTEHRVYAANAKSVAFYDRWCVGRTGI